MKKLLVALLALGFVVGLVAESAVAEDRLSLSGAYRARGFVGADYDFDTNTDEDRSYIDQRMRVQMKIKPADGVMAVIRTDFAEGVWGDEDWAGSRYNPESLESFHVDRAYLDVTKGMLNVKVGQQYVGLGNNFVYDNNTQAIVLTIKTPVTIRLGWAKIDEDQSGGANSTDEDGFEDIDHYLLDVGFKSDGIAVNGYVAMQKDGQDGAVGNTKDEPLLIGVNGKFNVGPAKIVAELNLFSGDSDNGTTSTDYTGTQIHVDAGMKMSDAVTLGVDLVYSDGNTDADAKIVRMPNAFFASRYYSDRGVYNTHLAPLGAGDIFDPLGDESGALGGGVYVKAGVAPTVTIHGQVMYLTADEDIAGGFDSGLIAGLGVAWAMAPKTTLAAGYHYADVDRVNADAEEGTTIYTRMQINF